MNEETYNILTDCVELAKRNDFTDYYRIKEGTPEEVQKIIRDIVLRDMDYTPIDLAYQIMNSALSILADVDFKDLQNFDVYEYEGYKSSVYNSDRLEYIKITNEEEIFEKIKEGAGSISEAAAWWYDDKVNDYVVELQNAIK